MWQQVQRMLTRVWPGNDARPVFVHGCWRTGSTYVWSKFRANPAYRCYYEPLHEALLKGRSEDFKQAFSAPGFYQSVGHPQQPKHYFSEYPLQPEGGVAHFEKRLSYERYCLDENDQDTGLEAYVSYLIDHAREHEQRPILQFNRGLLRSRWLRKRFNSLDVLVLRRPGNVWRSIKVQALDYYAVKIACIVGQNREHRYFSSVADRFEVPSFKSENAAEECQFYCQWAAAREDVLYSLFYYFYSLTFLYNLSVADAVLDLDAISESVTVRLAVQSQLRSLRIPLDMSDCRPQKHVAASEGHAVQQQQMIALLKTVVMPELALAPAAINQASQVLNEDLRELLGQFSMRVARAA